MIDRSDDPKQIRLSRGESWKCSTESVRIVMRAVHRHEFHPAAGGHERVGEKGILAGPGDSRVERRRNESGGGIVLHWL